MTGIVIFLFNFHSNCVPRTIILEVIAEKLIFQLFALKIEDIGLVIAVED